jgi:hypothetical protein
VQLEDVSCGIGREHRNLPAREVGKALTNAAVRNNWDVESACELLEIFAGEMRDRAGAGGSVGELARVRTGISDELGECAHRQRGMHDDRGRAVGEDADGGKILDRIIRRICHGRRHQHVRGRAAEQDAVSVGLGMRDIVGADRTATTAAVVDHDGTELRLDSFRPDAADDVVHAGRHRRNHQTHRPIRITVLSPPARRRRRNCRHEQTKHQQIPSIHRASRLAAS